MVGTIGFDLDMTLVDSSVGIERSMQALARETGRFIDVPLVLSRLGSKLEAELGQWFPPDEVTDASQRYREIYFDECVNGTTAFAGASSTLDEVHARGGSVLVVTAKSAPLAQRCLEHVGLEYDALVGLVYGTEKTAALHAHGAHAYVGDTVTDVASALAAGATAVAVSTGPDRAEQLRAAGAHVVCASMVEVAAWVRGLPTLT
ncbi:MAG: haloacid dehalogenase [Actinomycetia bacterium]|nr:haloacid dehalogenase [Actinomycetes bacterium]